MGPRMKFDGHVLSLDHLTQVAFLFRDFGNSVFPQETDDIQSNVGISSLWRPFASCDIL